MANTKISALTAASTPVAGTEVLPIVQSSATVKVSISDLTPGLSTITAAKGGTGQTSYAVGDILYANTTTSLAKLADVATGNALISGGVSTAPSWGKIGLTTHVSGTLAVGNGGTGQTTFTAGQVLYGNGTSGISTSSKLYFDGNNLGIQTSSPNRDLYILGNNANGPLVVYNNASSTNFAISLGGTGTVNGVATGASAAACLMTVNKDSGSGRSINAAGTLNAIGTDYAEYMVKAGDFTIAKGDICGVDSNGKLTNVFDDAIAFVVKSTNPSYVGGDSWFVEDAPLAPTLADDSTEDEVALHAQQQQKYESDLAGWKQRRETARALVDRIAFSGQVPVNVQGAQPGQYIVPVNDNGAIKGAAISNPTFEQYQAAIGKVIAIEPDGRAKIIVKII